MFVVSGPTAGVSGCYTRCWARSSPALSFSFVRFSLAVKLFAGDDLSNWHGRHLLWPGSRGKRPDPGAQRTVCSSAAPPSRLRDRTACGAVQVLGFCRLLRSPLRHAATARSLAIPACLELGLTTLCTLIKLPRNSSTQRHKRLRRMLVSLTPTAKGN